MELVVRDLGRMAYGEAYALQRELQGAVIASRGEDVGSASVGYLLLVEHDPPVITVSGRKGAGQHVTASAAELQAAGVKVVDTDRGGDVTYHGPGQLVVYPILDLNALGLRIHGYVRMLEQIVIDVIGRWGVEGGRDTDATGVWVGGAGNEGGSKVCAIGVRVTRWVTMHGLALNVTTNLDHFELIVPCGLVGRTVTSLARELGSRCPSMEEVKAAVVEGFREHIVREQG